MDQFFKRHKLPKLIQGEIDYLNSPMSIRESESMLYNYSEKNIPDPDSFTCEFYPKLKGIPIFHIETENKKSEHFLRYSKKPSLL